MLEIIWRIRKCKSRHCRVSDSSSYDVTDSPWLGRPILPANGRLGSLPSAMRCNAEMKRGRVYTILPMKECHKLTARAGLPYRDQPSRETDAWLVRCEKSFDPGDPRWDHYSRPPPSGARVLLIGRSLERTKTRACGNRRVKEILGRLAVRSHQR